MADAAKRRIGLMGGTFNPIHSGHTMVAQFTAEFGGFDEVWLMLSPANPLKPDTPGADDNARIEMLLSATADIPHVKACLVEFDLPRPSFTANTLRHLSDIYPDCTFTPIIGADNWLRFNCWREYEFILQNFPPVIYPRPGYPVDKNMLPEGVRYIDNCPVIQLSSTFIRRAITSGHCVSQFLPTGVYDYIMTNSLYQ